MMRSVYIQLLRLHPPRFRQRYGDEMLGIFDAGAREGCAAPLIVDAVVSLARQWTLRPGLWKSPVTASVPQGDGVPAFSLVGDDSLRPGRFATGALLTVVVFGLISFLISHGGQRRLFLIGSHHPSVSHMLRAPTNAIPDEDLGSEVHVNPYPEPRPMSPYFKMILVLGVLDTDRDGVISSAEMDAAPAALKRLDTDHNGKLDAEECGGHFGPKEVRTAGGGAVLQAVSTPASLDPQFVRRAKLAFMRIHPVLATLDADGNGEISSTEMRSAPVSLRRLDRNGDGRLTESELLPDPVNATMLYIMAALDRNGDGRISMDEAATGARGKYREMLARADRNRDGFVTEDELTAELLRAGPAGWR